jgi:predicted component of type VI protein secretion system
VWAVASVMAGSVARVGWPTEITGRDSGLIADLAIRPYGGNDHEPIQIPLQAYVSPQAVQDLQDFGFMPLSCRPNSDVAFVGQAPTLYQPLGYSEKSTRRHRLLLQSLPYQLFAGRLAACVAHHTDRLITGKSPGEIEAGFEALLWNLVGDSGAGCQVTVRLERHPDRPEESLLVLSLRTGTRVLHGAEVELQVPVLLH